MSRFRASDFKLLASGLGYPEGPVAMPDGTVLLVEIKSEKLTRVAPDGSRSTVAKISGGPNGAAIGPDGDVYICNNGGLQFVELFGNTIAGDQPADFKGGSIQKLCLKSGELTTLYTGFKASDPLTRPPEQQLKSPDDLVFDTSGGFWVTDWGHSRGRARDRTGIYYARADGSLIEEKIYPMAAPNGIGLSPDEKRLYVSETYSRRVLYFELEGPGQIKMNPNSVDGSHLLTAEIGGILDSMALDEEGNVYVATMLPHGPNPEKGGGGFTVIAPDGVKLDFLEFELPPPVEYFPSNLCFGGPDRKTAYFTLAGTGRLVSAQMEIPGLKLAF